MEQIKLQSVEHAIDLIKSNEHVQPVGAGTKPLLIKQNDECVRLDCRGLDGLMEYEPTEFTFTAKSGTPLAAIHRELEANGQYLPFDPPLMNQGATLGGTVAAGLNGPCSLRYGGIRDFILGIRFITGTGNHVGAGGKVVKNAAGFDLPKFFVGSCGQFGLMTELTLKVFPRPERFETLIFSGNLAEQIERVKRLILTPLEVDAIDLFESKLCIRIGGSVQTIDSACKRIVDLFEVSYESRKTDEEENLFWMAANSFSWQKDPSSILLKIPCQIPKVLELDAIAKENQSMIRFSLGGQVAYISADSESAETLRKQLLSNDYRHIAIRGDATQQAAGNSIPQGEIGMSVKRAIDPDGRFQSLSPPA